MPPFKSLARAVGSRHSGTLQKEVFLYIPPRTGWLKQEESKVPAECEQPEEAWKGEREGIPREGNSHRKIPVSQLNLSST